MTHRFSTDTQTLAELATVLKALSDQNRLKILDVLLQGVSCNCELNDQLGLPPNLLSHHLRVLREAGLVTSRRDVIDGRWIYYEVDPEVITRWQRWLADFLDPARLKERPLCGPEGQQLTGNGVLADCETAR
jgi:ArsR family transcriptional regulator